jgi:hypothetical protein
MPLRFSLGEENKQRSGIFRDAANAAWLSAMYADLLGVDPERAFLAQCMAKQTVDFILGKNPLGLSFQVGMGTCVSLPALHRQRGGAEYGNAWGVSLWGDDRRYYYTILLLYYFIIIFLEIFFVGRRP